MRRLLGTAAVLAVLAASPAAALDVCVEGAYPPFSEVTADGTIVGFDIDIAAALCEEIGETCTFRLTRWERMIPALTGEVCDAIVASMSDTDERRRLIDFTERYYRSPVRFVGLAGAAEDDTPEALAAKIVGVQRDTVNQRFMERHYPATDLRLYGNQEHVLIDLGLGRLDAVPRSPRIRSSASARVSSATGGRRSSGTIGEPVRDEAGDRAVARRRPSNRMAAFQPLSSRLPARVESPSGHDSRHSAATAADRPSSQSMMLS
ncbi:MAG TPA: transporter substrate-binding domain-containing protein, partial [Amaricoccus sp.]|nr:transporter substrate-binding domain-containing protein [Amaricoccus sp.]